MNPSSDESMSDRVRTEDLRAEVLLDELNAVEQVTPGSGKNRYLVVTSCLLAWLSVGTVTHWRPTHPLMLATYGMTAAAAVIAYVRHRARRRRTQRVFDRHEELTARLLQVESDRQLDVRPAPSGRDASSGTKT